MGTSPITNITNVTVIRLLSILLLTPKIASLQPFNKYCHIRESVVSRVDVNINEFCSFHASMARLNTSSFPGYCGSCSAERGVASVLRSAAVKKVVPILSTRVEKVLQPS
jgi:hypothetical protein